MTDYNFKPKRSRNDFGWYGIHRLPHLDGDQLTQFITIRLCDSMPQEVLDRWRSEAVDETLFRKRVEKYLDCGYGACWLRDSRVANLVVETLKFHEGKKYELDSWVIMPNHAHIVLTPFERIHLPDVMHSIKSYSAQKANGILGRSGQFWQHESFDRYIRDSRHLRAVRRYIENNPVKARLCEKPEDWPYSSAFQRRHVIS